MWWVDFIGSLFLTLLASWLIIAGLLLLYDCLFSPHDAVQTYVALGMLVVGYIILRIDPIKDEA